MKVVVSDFGVTKEGKSVHEYILKNESGMRVSLLDFGAIIKNMEVKDKSGKPVDVVLGYGNLAGYSENAAALGSFIGRNANRIGGAKVTIDGVVYELEKNNGKNNLHSGSDRSHYKLFEAEIVEEEFSSTVTFSRTFPDMEQGFPGNLEMNISYTLTEENEFIIEYRGISDKDTVINPTNHSYFNLNGEGDILNHSLCVDADCFTAISEDLIPTGEILEVDGTPMDFRTAKEVGRDIGEDYLYLKLAGGYDHNYVLNNGAGDVKKIAAITGDKSGITMEIMTDLPGMQVYTANFLTDTKGKEGAVYKKHSGICFETQYFPNACNEKNFKTSIIAAGEEYVSSTVFRFR